LYSANLQEVNVTKRCTCFATYKCRTLYTAYLKLLLPMLRAIIVVVGIIVLKDTVV